MGGGFSQAHLIGWRGGGLLRQHGGEERRQVGVEFVGLFVVRGVGCTLHDLHAGAGDGLLDLGDCGGREDSVLVADDEQGGDLPAVEVGLLASILAPEAGDHAVLTALGVEALDLLVEEGEGGLAFDKLLGQGAGYAVGRVGLGQLGQDAGGYDAAGGVAQHEAEGLLGAGLGRTRGS